MSDSFTEVSSQSWFSRIGESIKGILIGILLFLISFVILFWNEGRAVQTYKSLKEVQGLTVAANPEKVDPANEGKPVYLTGKAVTEDTLEDKDFGVKAKALRMNRKVEMYQWKEITKTEETKKLGGGTEKKTTYDYEKQWSDKEIASSKFKHPQGHENPEQMPFESVPQVADPVTLGPYTLSESLVRKIDNFKPLELDPKAAIPEDTQSKGKIQVEKERFYIGEDPAKPTIGDARVSFQVVNPTEVSFISRQVKNTFEPYPTKAGDAIEELEIGTVSAENVFKAAHQRNELLTWILRGVGYFCMFAGLGLILKPMSVLADVVPLFGNMVGFGASVIAFMIAAALSLTTIAIAWLFYRPLLGGALLAAAIGVLVLVIVMLKKKRKPAAAAPAPA